MYVFAGFNGTRKEQNSAARKAMNSICQASASDLVQAAIVQALGRVAVSLPLDNLESTRGAAAGSAENHCNGLRAPPMPSARLVLQVHDELIFEVRHEQLDRFVAILRDSMENVVSLSVPMPVKISTGRSWGSDFLELVHTGAA